MEPHTFDRDKYEAEQKGSDSGLSIYPVEESVFDKRRRLSPKAVPSSSIPASQELDAGGVMDPTEYEAFVAEEKGSDSRISSHPFVAEEKGSDSRISSHPEEQSSCGKQSLRLQTLTSNPAPQESIMSAPRRQRVPALREVIMEAMRANRRPPIGKDWGFSSFIKATATLKRSAPTDTVMRSISRHVPGSLESLLHGQSSKPHAIPLRHLETITDNFSDERIVGRGGSGVVYKGVLQTGEIIAVKKIVCTLMPGLQTQFENEVSHLMELKHANIVRCLGYCYEVKKECLPYDGRYVFAEMAERLLCLEYMPNQSLDKYISDESSGLDWSTRYNIIEGICYGLCHLHGQTDKPIIHLDLKPANILLDNGMVPKITDFGLSRQLDQHQTIKTSSFNGTLGYIPPELFHGGTVTPKSDIFSLGVIIVEVITGDKPDITGNSSDEIIELTLKKWADVLQRSPGHGSLEMDCKQIKRCIQVGLICVNPDRKKRPPITKVINMLQGSESIDCHITNEAT